MNSINSIFSPKSIAILGASNDESRIGGRILAFIKKYGFKGSIFPVNPKYNEIQGLQCYQSLREIKEPIDVVIIGLARDYVIDALKECANVGAKGTIILSAGFGEVDTAGKELEVEIKRISEQTGLVICGPNTVGLINFKEKIAMSFGSALEETEELIEGPIGYVTQSGALGGFILAKAINMGIGFQIWAATGNEAVLSTFDLLNAMADEPGVEVLAGYIESAADGNSVRKLAEKAIEKRKPLVLMKSGASQKGAKAASSHTGAMSTSDRVLEAIFKKYGILRAKTIDDTMDNLVAFTAHAKPKGRRIAIVSTSGGAGVLGADACEELGLELVDFHADLIAKLREVIPSYGSVENPIDITANLHHDRRMLKNCLEIIAADQTIDVIVLTAGAYRSLSAICLEAIIETQEEYPDKPIYVSWTAPTREMVKKLRQKRIPLYEDIFRCMKAIKNVISYHEFLEQYEVPPEVEIDVVRIDRAKKLLADFQKGSIIPETVSKKILELYQIPLPDSKLVISIEQVIQTASHMGYPIVLKGIISGVSHKTELGLVKLNLRNDAETTEAFEAMQRNVQKHGLTLEGVLVEQFLQNGTEVVIGMTNDKQYGPLIVCGSGGIYTEVYQDIVIEPIPLSTINVQKMINQTRVSKILHGARGIKRDIDGLSDIVLKVGILATELKDLIAELDINPVLVLEERALAVDALIKKL